MIKEITITITITYERGKKRIVQEVVKMSTGEYINHTRGSLDNIGFSFCNPVCLTKEKYHFRQLHTVLLLKLQD